MSGIWADFPSGSRGLYGLSAAAMLNGPWAAVYSSLAFDPDPLVGSAGIVLQHGANPDGPGDCTRLAVPVPHQKVGLAHRFWVSPLPAGTISFITFNSAANAILYTFRVMPNGGVTVYRGTTLIATAANPVITADAYNHLEYLIDLATGEIEVRKNGVAVPDLTFTDGSPPVGTIGLVGFPDINLGAAGGSLNCFSKDIVVYDGSGAQVNSFQGAVSVFYRPAAGDITLGGWTTSAGATGTPLIDDPRPSNVFTATAQLDADGSENIRIGDTYYRPTVGSVDAGAPAGTLANPWLVALGADLAASLENLFNAVGATGTPGTTYSTALTAHPAVSAVGYSATQILVQSNDGVTTSYVCTETMAAASWASGTMNVFAPQDLSYISAADTPPAEAEFALGDLPPDITSIKFIVPAVRAAKVDGGDGNLQIALSPDGVAYDTGPDTPITTAFTYWGNPAAPFVSHLNPATGNPWTPGDFAIGVRLRIDRTI